MAEEQGKIYFKSGLDNSQLRSGANEAKSLLHGIGDTAADEGERIEESFKSLGKTVAGVFAISQVKDFAVNVAKVRGEFQQLEMSFKTLLGSADKADALMNQLINTAMITPFGMSDIAKASKQLLAYGVAAEDVNDTLIRLGDIAAGLSIPIGDLAYLYGTTMVQGRLFTQDLRQFTGRGIPLTEELANQFGVAKEKVGELVTAGKVGFPEVQKAIISLTSEGSKFGGLMAAQSQTITGQISNLEDAVEQMINNIGKQSEGFISGAIGAVAGLVENYEKVGKVIAEVIAAYGVYKATVITLTTIENLRYQATLAQMAGMTKMQAVTDVLKAKTAALNTVLAKNPYVLIGAAVAALAVGVYKLATAQTEAEKAQAKLNKTTTEYNKSVTSERVQIDSLFARLKAAKKGTEEYEAAKKAIISQYGSYLTGLGKEVEALQDVEGAYKAITTAAIDAAKARALEKATGDAADTYADKEVSSKKTVRELLLKQFGDQKGEDGLSLAETYYWKIVPVIEGKEEMTDELRDVVGQFDRLVFSGGGMFGGGTSYTDNALKKQLDAAAQARQIYNDTMAEANRLYGSSKSGKEETTDKEAADEPAKVVKDKAYWKKYKEEQEALLDAMEDVQLNTEEAARIRANIALAQSKIDAYSTDKTAKTTTDKTADTAAEREASLNSKLAERTMAAKENALAIREAEIEGMKEGYAKEEAEAQLEYDRLMLANEKRQEEMVERLRDIKVLEWQKENPNGSKADEIAYRGTISADDLTEEEKTQLEAYAQYASETLVRRNKEALDTMLADVRDYNQQREAVDREYYAALSQMYTDWNAETKTGETLREGVTQGNVSELSRDRDEALNSIDSEFASREASFEAWCEQIADASLEQLKKVLADAQAELDKLEKSGTADAKALASARAKVATAQKAVNKETAKTDVGVSKRSIKEWEDLYKTLGECVDGFEEIGDAVGGTAGEIITTAGTIATSTLSMINGIVQLVSMSSASMTATAATAATAISTVEKASVILTVISAALSIAMAIANLFNQDKSKQEEIENLQERIDELRYSLEHPEIENMKRNWGDSVQVVGEAYSEMAKARDEYDAAAKKALWTGIWATTRPETLASPWLTAGAIIATVQERRALKEDYARKRTELLNKAVSGLADAYANVGYTADKALGTQRYANTREQLENLTEQMLLTQEQIDLEQSKKDSDDGTIKEYEQQIEELGQEAAALINDLVEDIIGGSADDIASELGDAFFDAFQAGEDYAEAWGDKVNDIVADIMKRMLVQKFLEEPLGEIFNKYKSKWFPNGDGTMALDAVIGSMGDFAADLNAVGADFAEIWENLPDSVKNVFTVTDEASREASEKGIATASQESVDELNGRMTAVQGHTYSISENTKLLVANTGAILTSVLAIESNTDRLAAVETNLKAVKDTLNDISLKGLKIK